MDSYYEYIQTVDSELKNEILNMAKQAAEIFQISDSSDSKRVVEQIKDIVDGILKTGEFPKRYSELADVAVNLGCLFGEALCKGYGWRWMDYGDENNCFHGVVSPQGFFSHAPMEYMYKVLSGNNLGLDGKNDNTILLLYNMLEHIDDTPADKMYFPLA